MNKFDLISELALKARALGIEPPSEAKFESWVQKKLLPKAQAVGVKRGSAPIWSYPEETLKQGTAILELEARGAKRTNQLAIGLFTQGFQITEALVRTALVKEFNRFTNAMRRDGWRNVTQQNINTHEVKPDDLIIATKFVLPDPEHQQAIGYALFGNSEEPQMSQQIILALTRLVENALPEPFAQLLLSGKHLEQIWSLMVGLLGSKDETDLSFSERVNRVEWSDFVFASVIFRVLHTCQMKPNLLTDNLPEAWRSVFSASTHDIRMQAGMLGFLVIGASQFRSVSSPEFAILSSEKSLLDWVRNVDEKRHRN